MASRWAPFTDPKATVSEYLSCVCESMRSSGITIIVVRVVDQPPYDTGTAVCSYYYRL